MKTEAEFSGTGQFKVIKKVPSANKSKNEVSLYDEYIGRYQISRNIEVGGVARFSEPHLSISKVGKAEPDGGSLIDYVITIINDGSRALGPVYVLDIFPQGTEYVSSSLRPSYLTSKSANWTLVSLDIGQSSIIDLRLKAVHDKDNIVNMVQAMGGYNNRWVSASNISVLKPSWLNCCPPQLFAIKNAYIDPQDPELIHYNITLKNRENYTMAATITDQLPAGLVFLNSSVTPSNLSSDILSWDIIDIKPGVTKTINYTTRALKSGIFENQAHIVAYPTDGTEPISTDIQSSIELKGTGYTASGSGWQPPACFGLNCTLQTQQGTDDDWVPCDSCGVSEPQYSADLSCPFCNGSDTSDDGYDIP